MYLKRTLFILKRLGLDYYNYYCKSFKQNYSEFSDRTKLECNTHEIGQFIWHRLLPIVGTNPYPPHELMLMCCAALWLRPKLIVEWGTNIGIAARIFHEVNIRYKLDADIHSIDLPDSSQHIEHPGLNVGLLISGLRVHLHQGDGATVAASILRDKGVQRPLIFIDGDHAKDSVIRDAKTVLEVVPRAGLLFHDTFFQPMSNYNHGPYEAIQEILKDLGNSVQIIEAGLGPPGMTFVIQK